MDETQIAASKLKVAVDAVRVKPITRMVAISFCQGVTQMTEQEFDAGHVFFRPGDSGDRAYLLHEGKVELLTGAVEAYTRVGLFDPGAVFGEMALIEERPRVYTARAVTAGRATAMTRDE